MDGASFWSTLPRAAWLLEWPKLMQRLRTWRTRRPLSALHPKRNALLAWCVLAGALFGLSLAVYWPLLDGFFVWDDFTWLRAAQNADVPATVRRAFTFPSATPFQRPTPFWRPLVDLYFIAGWRVFGEHATVWHVSNLVLHAANASLLAALSWRLTRSALVSVLAAALFAILPTYGFAVTWISSVTELLAAFYFLLALVLYTTFLQSARRPLFAYGGALAALLLALLAKESTISLPLVLVGLIVVVDPPRTMSEARSRTLELLPFVALTVAYVVFQYSQQYDSASSIGLYKIGGHAWRNLWSYLEWIMVPLMDDRAPWVLWVKPIAASALLLAGCAAILLRNKVMGFAFIWILLALLPYLFFLSGVFSRYSYLAALPLSLFAASLAVLAGRWLRPRIGAFPLAGGLVVGALLLGFLLANETRGRHAWIDLQAELSDQLFHDVPALCGDLPPESTIYVQNSPVFDITRDRVIMALNVAYSDVFVTSAQGVEPPDAIAVAQFDCAVLYDVTFRQYTRLD